MMNPDVALPIESFTPDEEHAFRIDAPKAVQGVLRDIARHNERVALYFDSGEENVIITVVLDVGPTGFILDATRDPVTNQKIVESSYRYFVSAHLQAKVQFPIARLEPMMRDGESVFQIDFPEQLTRLQRRDFFRLYLPPGLLKCHFPDPVEGSQESVRLVVRDISEGGMSLYDDSQMSLKPGDEVQNCRLTLEDETEIVFGLQVRHSVLTRMPSGEERTCLGCRFITLSTRMASQLQRFITRRQRERLP